MTGLFLGYSYDYTMNALNAAGDVNTHEIIISYTFPSTSGRINQEKWIFWIIQINFKL